MSDIRSDARRTDGFVCLDNSALFTPFGERFG